MFPRRRLNRFRPTTATDRLRSPSDWRDCQPVWEQIGLDATLALYVGLFDSSATMRTLSCAQPRWIEIPVGFTIIRQARHVPVADQWRIGFPN